MAKAIRNPTIANQNWVDRTKAASGFYVSQAQAAAWKVYAASDQAEKNYSTAITNVVSKKLRQAGVNAVSDETWKKGISDKGSARQPQGVDAAQTKHLNVMNKLIPALDATRKALPARGVRGSAENIQRSVKFQQDMAAKRGTFKA